jgi:eukaryotic-like serine/threonine-protein kinase
MTPVREGDLLAGKYRVERVIGVGGMGVVVAARHEQLGQLVAIKFLRDDVLGNEDSVERFLREARSAVRLKSEHVARVIDVGKLDSGSPYIVMEFLEGDDLGQILEERGPLAPEAAVQLVLQACEAVAEAHAAGIVHRDLKPQNLFLTHTVTGMPRLKVLDFGVSKASGMMTGGQGALTRTRSMLGSPLYMSPEQMRSAKDVDARADVWALGVVLFELLTRRWPFEAQNMPELCLKVVTEPPQSLLELRPEVPPGLVAIVERCLEKDPAARYADAAALAEVLDPFGPGVAPRRAPSSASLERHVSVATISRTTLVSSDAQITPGPSAWDSASKTTAPATSAGASRLRSFVWAGAVGTVAVMALVLVLSRHGANPASTPSTPTPTVVQPAAMVPPAVVEAPAPPQHLAPILAEAPPPPSVALPEAGALPQVLVPPRTLKAAPHPSAVVRAAKTDDDIPALR